MELFLGLFIIFFILSGYLGYMLLKSKKDLEISKSKSTDEVEALNIKNSEQENIMQEQSKKISFISGELDKLSKYKAIVNAEAEADKILYNAQTESFDIKILAEKNLNEAFIKSQKIINDAELEANKFTDILNEAKQKTNEFVKTELAMRNIIKGYGHDYLIPNISVLDNLAEQYSWAQAGEELKNARAFTRSLVKNKKAATCEYVDTDKYNTAIKFVTDAFNGKVDSALSKVKYDNYGTIKQQIEDAFNVVIETGRAFRNARVTEEYLNARLEELKWAVATNELKKNEQEEQRAIKEQMREEERAQKEIQKAIELAEKEEKMLKKAMEEARKQIETATQEERLAFELKLQELQEKLLIAEDKNKRALSMAQQTRSGHVYIISNIGSFGENIYKIGMTRRLEPKDRVTELGDASVPFSFDIHAMIYSSDAPGLEKTLHKKFANNQVNRVNPRKEFFDVSLSDIKNTVNEMGIEAHWTITAEAKEYYESKAMKEPLKFIEDQYSEEDM